MDDQPNTDQNPFDDTSPATDRDLALQPLDPAADQVRKQINSPQYAPIPLTVEVEAGGYSFGVIQLLLSNVVLAILFSYLHYYTPHIVAGLLGVFILGSGIFIFVQAPPESRWHTAWWCLVGCYLLALAVSFFAPADT